MAIINDKSSDTTVPQIGIGVNAYSMQNFVEDMQESLADFGVTVVKYTGGDEDSRHAAVNSVDGVRFSKKRSIYNEYETLVMRWNNSTGTNFGDCQVFSTEKKHFHTDESV